MSKKKQDLTEPIEVSWRGIPFYQCPQCPKDSEDRSVIETHIREIHGPQEPHPLAPKAVTAPQEEPGDGTNDLDGNAGNGAESDGGDSGDGDGGGRGEQEPVRPDGEGDSGRAKQRRQ